jgi:hypothetical protein
MEPTQTPTPSREPEILVEYPPRTPIRSRALRPPGAPLTEPEILADYLPTSPLRRVDGWIAELGARQHARVARWQLLRMGITDGEIKQRIERETLHKVANGVYAVGAVVHTLKSRCMTAVLVAGPGAVLSHRSAGALQGLRGYSGRPEVTVAADRRNGRHIIYRQATLPQDEVMHIDGIPCTIAARTIFDLASQLRVNQLKVVLHEADCNDQLWDTVTLPDLLSRYPGRRGNRTSRELLARYALNRDVLLNDFEADFETFCEEIGVPPGRANYAVEAQEEEFVLDRAWPERRFGVELDGRGTHDTDQKFESDRYRDRKLLTIGWRTIRVTPRMLYLEREELAHDLLELLGTEHRSSPARNAATSALG